MTFLAILATTFGTITSLSTFFQVYRIFKRKSAKDISILAYSFVLVNILIWISYGIEIKNIPIIASNGVALISNGLIAIGWFLYGRN